MNIGVVYAGAQQVLLECRVEGDVTVADVIAQSGILDLCPEIDLNVQKIGIYGRLVKPDTALKDGDRIEIYRKITRVMDDDDDDDDD